MRATLTGYQGYDGKRRRSLPTSQFAYITKNTHHTVGFRGVLLSRCPRKEADRGGS